MHLVFTRLLLGLAQTCCCWSIETQTVRCTLRHFRLPLLYFTLLYFTIWISLIVKFSSCLVLPCPVLIVVLWRALWYAACRVILLYICDPRSDTCAVMFCSSRHTRVTSTLMYALSCFVLIIPVRPPLWYTLCSVLCFDHPHATPTLICALSCSVLIIPMRPPLWYTLCRVLFWSYQFDPHFDIVSIVFCFDHTRVTPTLIYSLSCSVLIIPVWPPLWYALSCSVLIIVVWPPLWYALSCSVLIIPVWPPLWYTLCRVLFWSYVCDPHSDIRSVVFCFDHTCVTPTLIYVVSVLAQLICRSLHCSCHIAMVTRIYLIVLTFSVQVTSLPLASKKAAFVLGDRKGTEITQS